MNKKILVVDDNKDIVEMYGIYFDSMGYETQAALSGNRALEIFKDFKPDFALLDIGLPDIDGYELCKKMMQMEEGKNTVFLSQSGWGSKDHFDKAYEAGFKEHFIKPIDHAHLEKILNEYSGSN